MVIYFSGTGNSQFAATQIVHDKNFAVSDGCPTEAIEYKAASKGNRRYCIMEEP